AESMAEVRTIAEQLAQILRDSPATVLVNFDWGEKNKTIRLAVNQDKVRQAGLSSDSVAQTLNMILAGEAVTQVRDAIDLIGVVAAMLATGAPMGFVATLGIIALAGMIIRNSVILVVQIEDYRAAGKSAWEAVVDAADHRLRPILLTAAAAMLGMIPIMH